MGGGQNLRLNVPVYDNREFSNSCFLSPVRELRGNRKEVVGYEISVMWPG